MERRLAALFSADVQGYSRLMGDDDVATVHTLTAYKSVMTSLVHQHRGRVVDALGDNMLAEFASAVDALQCAVAIQDALQQRNTELPPHRQMAFRIGLNLGDVLVDGDRIYGDGVNIAARLEGLADGGGICISGSVYEQVANKLAFTYDDLGEQHVKNIARPVRVYRVNSNPDDSDSGAPASNLPGVRGWRKTMVAAIGAFVLVIALGLGWYAWQPDTPKLPSKPSIAVLAFDNMSTDPRDAYLGGSFSENIITQLAKIPQMFVVARNSSFIYQGKSISIVQVGRELGVHYVLEGCVQKADAQIRITAQLIDATTGAHLWAESYDRRFVDLFAIQDEIALKVAKSLQIKLTQGGKTSLLTHSTNRLEAWAAAMKALQRYGRFTREDNIEARQLLQQAIDLDAAFAWAYAGLGWTYWQAASRGWSQDPDHDAKRAWELAAQSLRIDEGVALAHALKSRLYVDRQAFDEAITAGRRALELEPNNPDMYMNFAWRLLYAGQAAEAATYMDKAKRLHPHPPHLYFLAAGRAFYLTERYEEALVEWQQWLTAHPRSVRPHVNLAAAYAALGRQAEARAQVVEVMRKRPGFSASQYATQAFGGYQEPHTETRFLQHLRQAGLPD